MVGSKLIMLLSHYQEPQRNLERSITDSVRAGCTHVVAVDGAYAALPGGTARSAASQIKHIRNVCKRLNVPLVQHQRDEVWHGNEIEKRSFMFDLAYRELAPTPSDFFFVMDADQGIEAPWDLKPWLAQQSDDTFSTLVYEHDAQRFNEGNRRRYVRQVFRCVPGIHVTGNHYTYVDGTDRVLWGAGEVPGPNAPLVIHNYSTSRGAKRNRLRENYYEARTEQELERHGPHTCDGCDREWRLSMPVQFEFEPASDGSSYLVSQNTAFLCDDHAPDAIRANRADAVRLAAMGRDDWPLEAVLHGMRSKIHLKPLEQVAA